MCSQNKTKYTYYKLQLLPYASLSTLGRSFRLRQSYASSLPSPRPHRRQQVPYNSAVGTARPRAYRGATRVQTPPPWQYGWGISPSCRGRVRLCVRPVCISHRLLAKSWTGGKHPHRKSQSGLQWQVVMGSSASCSSSLSLSASCSSSLSLSMLYISGSVFDTGTMPVRRALNTLVKLQVSQHRPSVASGSGLLPYPEKSPWHSTHSYQTELLEVVREDIVLLVACGGCVCFCLLEMKMNGRFTAMGV